MSPAKRVALALSHAAATLAIGCGHHASGPTITVSTSAGAHPAAGAFVVTYDATTGEAIDQASTDGDGSASLTSADGALVGVAFADDSGATTGLVVTAPSPAAGVVLAITGPEPAKTPVDVGSLTIAPTTPLVPAPTGGYDVLLGCTTVHVASLPRHGAITSIDAGEDAPSQVVGYTAGRLALDSGSATFAPTSWLTTTTDVPVTDTASPMVALGWAQYADGLPFSLTSLSGTSAPVWIGLAVDATELTMQLTDAASTQRSVRESVGVPSAISVAPTDLLGSTTATISADNLSALALSWTAGAPLGAAVNLHATWSVANAVVWDAVLPPDATAVRFPPFDPTITPMLGLPTAGTTVSATLRYLDSDSIPDFESLIAAGIFVDLADRGDTIAPRPMSGQLRYTSIGPVPL